MDRRIAQTAKRLQDSHEGAPVFGSPATVLKGKAGVVIGTCDPGDAGHLRDTGFSRMLVTSHVPTFPVVWSTLRKPLRAEQGEAALS